MSPEAPGAYEELSPEAAARVDAVCDGFENAWKAVRSGAPVPRLSSFLDDCDGAERTVLAVELHAVEQACRKRYGPAGASASAQEYKAEAGMAAATRAAQRGSDAPAARPPSWPNVPGVELVEVLGSGGMGVVFKARQPKLDRDVAVKFLRDEHGADSTRHERFLQEARAVARLRHPHLVQLYEFGELRATGGAQAQPYLVLEYVSGGNLADRLRGSPQPPAEAARLLETLAYAVHFAHEQGIIHRDLKPANVLLQSPEVKADPQTEVMLGQRPAAPRPLTADLCAKITDFGLAKFLAGSDLTQSDETIGTPSYMAPEQVAGNAGPVTAAVDVYGLGAILYETLIGRPPFVAETLEATLSMVLQAEPVLPRRLQPTVPRDLETICLKCLRKEPSRRYATARDLADDLRRFQAGEPIRARPVGTLERALVWCRRKPAIAALLAALLLVFLGGSSGVFWQWHRVIRERDAVQKEKERAENHLVIVQERVKELDRLGHEWLQTPGQYRAGEAVLEQALALYKGLLPEEENDPAVRREAAKLYGHVAWIHQTLRQNDKALKAWDEQARLLSRLLKEEPSDVALRLELADCHRWRANMLRQQNKAAEARLAYKQAAELHEGLLKDYPRIAGYQLALANTLLNMAGLPPGRDQAENLEATYDRIIELERSAVSAEPKNAKFSSELALALEDQGQFFLNTGRPTQAEATVREAVEIHQRLRAAGQLKRSIDRYEARSLVRLARVLAATARSSEAEESYREAINLLDRPFEETPESAWRRAELAEALTGLANLLKKDSRRLEEVEQIWRRAIPHYEKLKADFPDNAQYRLNLVFSYLKLIGLLCELGRETETAEPLRKALAVDAGDPDVNNELAWFLATCPATGLRDHALALRLAKKAVAAQTRSANLNNTLAVAYYRNGDDRAAIAALETAMSLRAGDDGSDWFFLAMAHWRLGERDQARTWFDRAVQWMDKHKPQDEELRRFRTEAEALFAERGKS
jgi:serine/threonine protein kinase